jgi:hypothetical protein
MALARKRSFVSTAQTPPLETPIGLKTRIRAIALIFEFYPHLWKASGTASARTYESIESMLWDDRLLPDPHYPEQTACTHVMRWFKHHGVVNVFVRADPVVIEYGSDGSHIARHEQPVCLYVPEVLLPSFARMLTSFQSLRGLMAGMHLALDDVRIERVREIYTAHSHPDKVPRTDTIYIIENDDLYMACARTPAHVLTIAPTPSGYEAF